MGRNRLETSRTSMGRAGTNDAPHNGATAISLDSQPRVVSAPIEMAMFERDPGTTIRLCDKANLGLTRPGRIGFDLPIRTDAPGERDPMCRLVRASDDGERSALYRDRHRDRWARYRASFMNMRSTLSSG